MKAKQLSVTITDPHGRTRTAKGTYEEPLKRDELEFQLGILARSISAEPDPKTAVCGFCGAEWKFLPPWHQPNADVPTYCKLHGAKSTRVPPLPVKVACPTPKKRAFPSKIYADRWALRSSRGTGHAMRSYECPCGKHHITKKI